MCVDKARQLAWICLCSSVSTAFLLYQLPTSRYFSLVLCRLVLLVHHGSVSMFVACLPADASHAFSFTYVSLGNRITESTKTCEMENQTIFQNLPKLQYLQIKCVLLTRNRIQLWVKAGPFKLIQLMRLIISSMKNPF